MLFHYKARFIPGLAYNIPSSPVIIIISYDRTGNLVKKEYADGSVEEITYTPLGQLSVITDENGVTACLYDDGGRLISVQEPNGDTVRYTYDEYGNRLSMTYPDGKTAKYFYDDMNRELFIQLSLKVRQMLLVIRQTERMYNLKTTIHYHTIASLIIWIIANVFLLIISIIYPENNNNRISVISIILCFCCIVAERKDFKEYLYADSNGIEIHKADDIKKYTWDDIEDIVHYRGRTEFTFEIYFKSGDSFGFVATTRFRRYFLDLYEKKFHKVMDCANF